MSDINMELGKEGINAEEANKVKEKLLLGSRLANKLDGYIDTAVDFCLGDPQDNWGWITAAGTAWTVSDILKATTTDILRLGEGVKASVGSFSGSWNDYQRGDYYSALMQFATGEVQVLQDVGRVFAVGSLAKGAFSSLTKKIGGEVVETYYRSMSRFDYEKLLNTGRLPATSETFISPARWFSEDYNGVLVEFYMKPGTINELKNVAVGDFSRVVRRSYPSLPDVSSGWNANFAYFKGENGLINIGLGKGRALDAFNRNILLFRRLRVK
jgi:hypothetical protein